VKTAHGREGKKARKVAPSAYTREMRREKEE
jgi:hypothetical protein